MDEQERTTGNNKHKLKSSMNHNNSEKKIIVLHETSRRAELVMSFREQCEIFSFSNNNNNANAHKNVAQ